MLTSALVLVASLAAAPLEGAGKARSAPPARGAADPLRRGPNDDAYREALDLLYGGGVEAALARMATLAADAPEDPMGAYLEALLLCWKLEQHPESTALDREFERKVSRALELAETSLKKEPRDVRALLARGAAHGVRSRFHLFRLHKTEAARAAVRMREDLLEVRRLDPGCRDALFGLGLYDYYADVLPKLVKVVRFLARMPGGDRRRGLAAIEEAREGSLFHDREAHIQLYEIYASYERKPDRALEEIRALRRAYPDWPLWPLKLAEHLRDRMGLYAESSEVAREILETGRKGHPNYAGVALAMARVSLGESLLLDLRLTDARRELLPVREVPEAPGVAAQARLLLGRSLELEGDRDGALAHYRLAAAGPDRELRRRAQAALSSPVPPAQIRGWQLIAQARRLREAGRSRESADAYRQALKAWPQSREAALRVAEDEILHGHPSSARETLLDIVEDEDPRPPWLIPWSRLLLGQLHDLAGEREAAVKRYRQVLGEPYGCEDLRERAKDGLRQPFTRVEPQPTSEGGIKHSS